MSCCGNCSQCPGCGRSLELTQGEVETLRVLGELAFLPVTRKLGEQIPADPERPGAEQGSVLLCLERKGLIELDYDRPLRGYPYPAADSRTLRGTAALTARGQQVLELLEIQGAVEEG